MQCCSLAKCKDYEVIIFSFHHCHSVYTLFSSLLTLYSVAEHQRFHYAIMDIQKKIWDKDREILQLAARLHTVETTLQLITEDLEDVLQAITISKQRS